MGYRLRRAALSCAKSTGWARVVVGEIADSIHDEDSSGQGWPGIDFLASQFAVARSTIIRAVQDAEEAKDICVGRETGRKNLYRLSPALLAACAQYHEGATSRKARPVAHRDRSRSATASSAGAKKEAPASSALEAHPAIAAHREICGPVDMTAEEQQAIAQQVGSDAQALKTWRGNLDTWLLKGWHVGSIEKQLNRFATEQKREAARARAGTTGSASARGKTIRLDQIQDPTPEEYAAAEARAREQREERAANRARLRALSAEGKKA